MLVLFSVTDVAMICGAAARLRKAANAVSVCQVQFFPLPGYFLQ